MAFSFAASRPLNTEPRTRRAASSHIFGPVRNSHEDIRREMGYAHAQENARNRVGSDAALTIGAVTNPHQDGIARLVPFRHSHAELAARGQAPSTIVSGVRVRTAAAAKGHPAPQKHFQQAHARYSAARNPLRPMDKFPKPRNWGLDYDN